MPHDSNSPALHEAGLFGVKVTVRRSDRAKRMRLVLRQDGYELVLRTRTSLAEGWRFVEQSQGWMARNRPKPSPAAGVMLFRGDLHNVQLGAHCIGVRHGCLSAPSEGELLSWLRQQAESDILGAVQRRSAEMGASPSRVQIRDQRSRWGGCTSRKTVTLNWRLVMAPPEVLDYVVVHELAHLFEMNHSHRFWAIVERQCPEWRSHRTWLRVNAHSLQFKLASDACHLL